MSHCQEVLRSGFQMSPDGVRVRVAVGGTDVGVAVGVDDIGPGGGPSVCAIKGANTRLGPVSI